MQQLTDGMINVADALKNVLENINQLGTEDISIAQADGRILGEDLIARLTQPPVAVSAMDGYAVKAEDITTVPKNLTLIGESSAGNGFNGKVAPGQTVRIFTGAPIPNGTDAVVIQEDTENSNEKISRNKNKANARMSNELYQSTNIKKNIIKKI